MAYVWQRWLAAEFRKAGLRVREIEGWENRGRPASVGDFNPQQGTLTHHTGTRSSAQDPHVSLQTLITGRSDLPGPLCQWAVGHDGLVFVIAAGRANHAGRIGKSGLPPGLPLGADGNALLLGDEVMTDGTQNLPPAQLHALTVTAAVVHERKSLAVSRALRHEDTSGTGKWDIGQLTTDQHQTNVREALQGDNMPISDAEFAKLKAIAEAAAEKAVSAAIPAIADAVWDESREQFAAQGDPERTAGATLRVAAVQASKAHQGTDAIQAQLNAEPAPLPNP